VIWAAAGRSRATSKRAELADLIGVPDVPALARRSNVIVSVFAPPAARDVAAEVAAALDPGLVGTGHGAPVYVDANADSPATVRAIGELLGPDRVVDGAIIGPPAWEHGQTVLWLSGPAADEVATLFAGSPFAARVLGAELGTASALKACFALQSKALPAIWLEIAAAARAAGVGIIARVPLASGLLSGKYDASTVFAPTDHRSYNRHGEAFDVGETFAGVPFDVGVVAAQRVAALTPDGATTAQLALRWLIDQDGVSAVIPGARNPEQARGNAAAAGLAPLDAAQLDALRAIYDDSIREHVHARW